MKEQREGSLGQGGQAGVRKGIGWGLGADQALPGVGCCVLWASVSLPVCYCLVLCRYFSVSQLLGEHRGVGPGFSTGMLMIGGHPQAVQGHGLTTDL